MTHLVCQRHLFTLEENACYLNCAAYSPLLRSTQGTKLTPDIALVPLVDSNVCLGAPPLNSSFIIEIGQKAITFKGNPQYITAQHHFDDVCALRREIATFIGADDEDRICIMPAVSYGLAVVARNLHRLPNISAKKNIIVLEEEFPNNNVKSQ